MRRRFLRFAILAALLLGLFWWIGRGGREPSIAQGSLLVVELSGKYVDGPIPLLSRLRGDPVHSLLTLTSELRKAARDSRLDGVVLRVRALEVGWAQAEEIRQAIRGVSAKGRHTLAVLEVEGFGNAPYYVASAADRVVATPGGNSPFVGIAAEYLFLGGLFEKLGVDVEYERVGEFKSAVESYAETKMSDANRLQSNALLDSVEGHFVREIAAARGRSEEQVRLAIDSGPSAPESLVEYGLVDEVATFEAAVAALGEHEQVKADVYAGVTPASVGFEPAATFAIVNGVGAVVVGAGSFSGGSSVMASDTVADALRDAAKDPEVKAIVLRIDSPGGSPLASDLIWNAIRDVQKQGKPVVASFSDLAASGGYYVASAADVIVSQPQTLTGSIGVFVIRPVLAGLLEKLGVGVASITRGARADLLLSTVPLSPETRAVLREDVQHTYDRFLSRVAEGRGLDEASVDEVARGRVWTGEQALEVGLVDRLGGVPEAVLAAKEKIGLSPEADVLLVQYPAPRPLAEQVFEALQGGASLELSLPGWPAGARQLISALRSLPIGTPLLIGPAWIEIH
jgi:protease IV